MTVYKNIAFGLENLKWGKAQIQERVNELLDTLKIRQFVDRFPSELSGGQQQRVAIARTLAPKPKVLFMDEPLSNLDAKLRGEMRTELKRLHVDTNSTFIYVTHDQLEAMTLSTNVCLIESGKLQQFAPPLEIYRKPQNLFVADFMGNPTMNFIPAKVLSREGRAAELGFHGMRVRFNSAEELNGLGDEAILGVRPEYIGISERGHVDAVVYATLPTGMETTVTVILDDQQLSAVAFGSLDYPIDTPIRFDFVGDSIVLFDKETQTRMGIGSLDIL